MSLLVIIAFFPASKMLCPKSFAELISSFFILKSFTASLKELVFGAERFSIGLTFAFCITAIRGFDLKFFKGFPL